ncbi:Zn(II)2Cys6 transcription factor domain-containing protein [Aspergillus affinis]|uniref:Zn(II)2Cys6 transcription factor domain-containing protein n=1 Tax=Aspergillus affinis TaxID=1070780 RepID=UPI0022FDE9C8|nr:uncharacterized protein KD926_000109 [Aspergillus affinis]KAI9037693.1 hypothetical protein KD926_000109 [Aspergillus affinis]
MAMTTPMAPPKQHRARTGCLTCRDRHIKCDEAVPRCRNCSKSDRTCERGIRLNFIDIQTSASQPLTSLAPGTQIVFQDESRNIASGYSVGAENGKPGLSAPVSPNVPGRSDSAEHLSKSLVPSSRLITAMDEGLLMEVFVEKIGPWMDCLDAGKPFTTILPFYALDEPMLFDAIMACGGKYLLFPDASLYYEKALKALLPQLNTNKLDHTVCIVTAILLDAYNIMGDNIEQARIAKTSALLWKANFDCSNAGLAGACFWSNATMCLMSCLYQNMPFPWDPEILGVNIDSIPPSAGAFSGDEEKWTHRIIYICAKIAVLRGGLLHGVQSSPREPFCEEWEKYKNWCDDWAHNVPRSMMPLCYIPSQEVGQSTSFPHILLVQTCATVARLLYHTSCLLLAKIHPREHSSKGFFQRMQTRHALDICGIASQAEDKEVTNLAMHCLSIAADSLMDTKIKHEALQVFDKITRSTPWGNGKFRHAMNIKLKGTSNRSVNSSS